MCQYIPKSSNSITVQSYSIQLCGLMFKNNVYTSQKPRYWFIICKVSNSPKFNPIKSGEEYHWNRQYRYQSGKQPGMEILSIYIVLIPRSKSLIIGDLFSSISTRSKKLNWIFLLKYPHSSEKLTRTIKRKVVIWLRIYTRQIGI